MIQLAQKIHSTPLTLTGLAGMALLAARRGDWTEAAQLATLVQHHPASEQETRGQVAPLLEQAHTQQAITLPPPAADTLEQALQTAVATLLTPERSL